MTFFAVLYQLILKELRLANKVKVAGSTALVASSTSVVAASSSSNKGATPSQLALGSASTHGTSRRPPAPQVGLLPLATRSGAIKACWGLLLRLTLPTGLPSPPSPRSRPLSQHRCGIKPGWWRRCSRCRSKATTSG
jgi:hypothetical protein